MSKPNDPAFNVATSTVAMCLYNVLVSGPCCLGEARTRLAKHGYLFSSEALEEAAHELGKRGRIFWSDDVLAILGPPGMVVTSRDRETGDGWDGWQLMPMAKQAQTVSLDSFLNARINQQEID